MMLPPAPQTARLYCFGAFELETGAGDLRRKGLRIRLQEQPRRILTLLLERAGELVTREEFQRNLWDADTFVDFDLGLNCAVRKLRHALRDRVKRPRYIETLSRRGYRFVAPVAVFEPDPAQAPPQLFRASEWLAALRAEAAASGRGPLGG